MLSVTNIARAVIVGVFGASMTAFRESHRSHSPSFSIGAVRSLSAGMMCGAVGGLGSQAAAVAMIVVMYGNAVSFMKHDC